MCRGESSKNMGQGDMKREENDRKYWLEIKSTKKESKGHKRKGEAKRVKNKTNVIKTKKVSVWHENKTRQKDKKKGVWAIENTGKRYKRRNCVEYTNKEIERKEGG